MGHWQLPLDRSHLVSCPRTSNLDRWDEKLTRCWVMLTQQVKVVLEIGQRVWQAEDEPLRKEAGWGEARYREWRLEQLAKLLSSVHQL